MANYQSVKPIGQIDNYACWAACLSWWTKAMNRANKKTQIELIKIYDNGLLTDGNGAIMPSALESYVFPAFNLKLQKVNKDDLVFYQFKEPTIMIFRNPAVGGLHMNVVFDSRAEVTQGQYGEATALPGVTTMEPYYPYNVGNGKRTGVFLFRPFSYFTQAESTVYLGVQK